MQPDTNNFKTFFSPAFQNIADTKINQFLDKASSEISQKWWDKKYVYGVFYLAAHSLVNQLAAENGDMSGIRTTSSEKAGELQINYSTPTTQATKPEDIAFQSTWYGQEYLRMKKSIGVGFIVVYP